MRETGISIMQAYVKVGDVVRLVVVGDQLERIDCEAEVIRFSDLGPVVVITSPADRFVKAIVLDLVRHAITVGPDGFEYHGAFHGGIHVPETLWS